MNSKDLFQAFDAVDDDILARSEEPAQRRGRVSRVRWGMLAACLAMVIGVTGIAFAAEAKEYATAVDFFEENGLSMEGLSRADVKAVYQDISTRRFTDGRTAEVIQRSIPGVEIAQEPAPEDLEAIWDGEPWKFSSLGEEQPYQVETLEQMDEDLGFPVFESSILRHVEDGKTIWSARFEDFNVDSWTHVSGGLAVWGYTPRWSSELPEPAWLALLNEENGTILWQRKLDHGYDVESVTTVLDNGDGTWGVLSRALLGPVMLSQYSEQGEELSCHVLDINDDVVLNAARLGDGYLVQLGTYADRQHARLARLDREGNLTDNLAYEMKDQDCYLTDMTEYGGKVWLSGYMVPIQEDEGGRNEIAGILETIFERDVMDISSEELTPMVQNNYTAVLLLCDADGGELQTFYSVKGSLGASLTVTDDTLDWEVQRIDSTFFSPATSSFTIGGACSVYRYRFDQAGTLIGQEDTGTTADYRR